MKLRVERIKLNLTQRQLSDIANIGLNTIVKIEKGNLDSVKVGTLRKISEIFDISIVNLFFEDEE